MIDYSLSEFKEAEDLKKVMLKDFGSRLKGLRTEKGMTQQQVGDQANISYKYLSEIENGSKNPSAVIIYRLSSALEVPVCEILPTSNDCNFINMGNINLKKVERLFNDREKTDIDTAIKILELFFRSLKR